MRIAIAGASGFVGTHLIKKLREHHQVVALGRSMPQTPQGGVEWRATDLFSFRSTFDALKEIDVGIYLVHSMMPSSVLFQGSFHDTDLLLADNFARACKFNGVKRIIYLGGLMPEGYVSPHLESRREVEDVLHSTDIPTTVLRAGMIVGPGGSSFEILRSLVERLPGMVLPKWTQSATQAVFIDDIVDVLAAAVDQSEFEGKTLDVVNGESLTYEDLLRRMSRVLGVNRPMLPVPISSTGFSKLWVQIFGNSTYELVSPLIDSLLCALPQVQPEAIVQRLIRFPTFESMVVETFKREKKGKIPRPKRRISFDKSVRSIQRLPATPQYDCHWIAQEYMSWLPNFLPFLIRVRISDDKDIVKFFLSFLPWPLLVLKYIHGEFDDERKKFYIIGGWLTARTDTGWLEFRQVMKRRYTLAAIHEFVPSLPWMIYLVTQAQLHRVVMHFFGEHIKKS